ncbi:MAG TPA: hypothetical protein PLT82_08045 [Candidatus Hydrogenedens sp.]|nr:hypothetical protein [Candidatus Hydrogenedens sp.]HOK10392.1 hypothetical protein [Candidatus Hydrogenedens sp.]HOL18781.1 hypothetical protein [Candidatus Hydrogenedens sp.]HPP59067.1 hypothetical protein [Candidatus Hydrogenedens sp.]
MQTLISEENKNLVDLTTLEALLGSEARTKVFLVLFTNLGRTFYQRQVESATKLPLRAVQRELERLSHIGLIYQWKEGNRTWYQIDQSHPLVPILQSLILKVCSPIDRLRTVLNTNKSVRLAFYHHDKNEVIVVTNGDVFPESIEGIRLTILTTNEFMERMEQMHPELINVLKGAVDLLGNREDFLWRIIETNKLTIPKGENVL